jgi:hypothetical protein
MTMRTLKMLEEHNNDVPGCGSYHRGLWILKLLYHYDGTHEYNVYITNQFQPTFAQGEGGINY